METEGLTYCLCKGAKKGYTEKVFAYQVRTYLVYSRKYSSRRPYAVGRTP